MAGYHVEYSSMKFAAFMMSEYVTMATVSALIVTLFLGGWTLPGVHLGVGGWASWSRSPCSSARWRSSWLFVWVRWSLPRFRYDQLMRLGWKGLLPLATVNLVWVAVGVALGWKWI